MAQLPKKHEDESRLTALQMKNALDEFGMFEVQLHLRITAIAIERLGYSPELTRRMINFAKSIYGE